MDNLNVEGIQKEGGREGIIIFLSHRDKRIDEWVGSTCLQFDREGMLDISDSGITYRGYLGQIIDFVMKRENMKTFLRRDRQSRELDRSTIYLL